MRGNYSSAAFTTASGVQIAALATITVRKEVDSTLATLYALDGTTPLANPFTADTEGRFAFTADGIALGYSVQAVSTTGESVIVHNQPLGNLRYLDVSYLVAGYQPLDSDLTAIAALGTTGVVIRTGTGTATTRSVVGTANRVTVTNGDGLAGNITLTGPQDLHSGATPSFAQITVAGDPSGALNVATKQYVDTNKAGLDPKDSVRFRTTANISISGGGIANGTTHDGIVAATGDRVFVAAQTAPAENGIYIVPVSGAATRATDMDSWTEVPSAFFFVEKGTLWADTGWMCTSDQGGTIGSTSMTFSQFAGVGAYQPIDATLTALAAFNTNGILVQTAADTFAGRTITASNGVVVTNGDGVAGAPAFTADLASATPQPLAAAGAVGTATKLAREDHAHQRQLEFMSFACGDETTAITTGDKVTWRAPYAMTLTDFCASLTTAQASGATLFTVDVKKNGSTIFTTKPTFDNTEKTTRTAVTAFSYSSTAVAQDDELVFNVNAIGDGTAKGLKMTLIGRQSA